MAKDRRKASKLDTYEEAVRLREEGFSLRDIGEALGCSKQNIHKLLKGGPPASTAASTNASTPSVNQLTPRRRRFAKALLEGKTQRAAALEAADSAEITEHSADVWANRTLKDATFRKAFREMLRGAGLGEEDLARVHAENLRATKIAATATRDGKITDSLKVPDFATRQRAVDDAWRLHERLAAYENEAEGHPTITLNFEGPNKERWMEAFITGRRPAKTIDVDAEGVDDR